MNDSTAVAGDGAPTVEGAAGEQPGVAVSPEAGGSTPEASGTTVAALLRGGPAAGRKVEVPRIAGTYPMFIGVDGANYVRDKGAAETPVYNWWPAGASAPAGDPGARIDRR